MTQITLQNAMADLPRLIERARAGESITIVDGQEMLVRLDPVFVRRKPRQPGSMKDTLAVPANLMAPLTDDELVLFEGTSPP